jgi:hypothetical protein
MPRLKVLNQIHEVYLNQVPKMMIKHERKAIRARSPLCIGSKIALFNFLFSKRSFSISFSRVVTLSSSP